MRSNYFILGKKAGMFFDPMSRLKVLPSHTKEVPAEIPAKAQGKLLPKVEAAIKGGHIVEVPAPGTETATSVAPQGSHFTKMKDAQLVKYYEATFEVKAEDVKNFKALSRDEKVKFLEEAEAE